MQTKNGSHQRKNGFIALISAIIISSIVLVVVASSSLSGFFARGAALDAEYKTHSAALADACVDALLLKLKNNATYAGGDTVAVGSDSCTIFPGATGDPRMFNIQAIYNHSYTNLQITVDVSTLSIRSWLEVPTL